MSSASLSGRTVLVTGATSGIGYETARQLAERGATVLVHGRTAEEARAATDWLIAADGIDANRLCAFAADFTHLDDVEAMAARVVQEHPHLDVLVNNAAVAAPERHTVTADGNEIAFQVNFLAHYLLTGLLEQALTSRPGGRVVNVSSSLHRTGSIQWSDPNRARRYSRLGAYAQSQLALTVFAADLRVTAVSVHPGICEAALLPLYAHTGATAGEGAAHVVRLCDPAVEIVNGCEAALLPLYAHTGATAGEGAAHVVRLCDPAVEIVNGAYYDRDQRVDPALAATEERTVKRLNKLADILVGHTV